MEINIKKSFSSLQEKEKIYLKNIEKIKDIKNKISQLIEQKKYYKTKNKISRFKDSNSEHIIYFNKIDEKIKKLEDIKNKSNGILKKDMIEILKYYEDIILYFINLKVKKGFFTKKKFF